jgi:hypothetical protein
MIILLIILAGFLKVTGDVIHVPATFGDSWFKRFKGNHWFDPELSQDNKFKLGYIGYPIMSMFGDAHHTFWTLSILCWITMLCLLYQPGVEWTAYGARWTIFPVALFCWGLGANGAYGLWRKLLNKSI